MTLGSMLSQTIVIEGGNTTLHFPPLRGRGDDESPQMMQSEVRRGWVLSVEDTLSEVFFFQGKTVGWKHVEPMGGDATVYCSL